MVRAFSRLQSKFWMRVSWLGFVGAMLSNRDMCLGGGKPPARDVAPADAGNDASSDTGPDARRVPTRVRTRTPNVFETVGARPMGSKLASSNPHRPEKA